MLNPRPTRRCEDQSRRSAAGRLAIGLCLVAGSYGCRGDGAGPPEITLDRTACAECGMLISEPGYAAAYAAGRTTRVFDDIACLLRALDEHELDLVARAGDAEGEGGATAQVWLYGDDSRWIAGDAAFFVRSDRLETPMGGGIKAVADRAAAEELAARVDGAIFDDLAALRARIRSGESATERGRHGSAG
ncbi:MAG TPA: nitrous oxide reductase accessory protein NosL [Thermoanaerobaculia bacterium]|nr:nitrous oxide reductase accessory protein NosL [Thermoanaerobaculia bacterium]